MRSCPTAASTCYWTSDIGCRVRLFGPATRTTSIQTNNNYEYPDVRFRPRKAPRFAEVKPTELIYDLVELGDFFGLSCS